MTVATVRFRAVGLGGTLKRYDLPVAPAEAMAAELRRAGFRVGWFPAPPPVSPAPGPTRTQRKAERRANRVQRRQFRELGVTE